MENDASLEGPGVVVHAAWREPHGEDRQNTSRSNLPSCWPDFMVGQVSQPVRVLLVDDDSHMSHVIAQQLLSDQRINLVGQATGFRDGRRKIGILDFDVLVVGINLGDGNGFDLIKQVKSRSPMIEVVVVSSTEDEEHALHAFELGATGYLIKNSWFDNFPQAVLQVVNGGASITPNLVRRLLRRIGVKTVVPSAGNNRADQLSKREREVLKMVACGFTSAEIGSRLMISAQTVNTHIRNLYQKLQVHSRAHAVSCASERGLL